MNILIKNVSILDPERPSRQGKNYDIHISNGIIKKIAKKISEPKAKIIDASGCYASVGFFDIGTQIGEPGYEHRETIQSVAKAATKGGYTGIAPFPNTNPAIDHSAQIEYILNKSNKELPDFYPIGAISKGINGKDLAELIDMHQSGAIAFSDGHEPIESDKLIQLSMEYSNAIHTLIINMPYSSSFLTDPQMHEGEVSTSLGLNGIPTVAETIILHRDLALQQYTGARFMSYGISSKEGVKMIKEHKKTTEKLFASCPVMNIAFDDNALHEFDANYKTIPPIRTKGDQSALKRGLKDGSIDCLTSNHFGIESELKAKSFAYAAFGAASLEVVFSIVNSQLDLETMVKVLAINPRKVLNIEIPKMIKGEKANLVIFDPNEEWTFTTEDIESLSQNYPLLGHRLKGKVKATICGKSYFLDEN